MSACCNGTVAKLNGEKEVQELLNRAVRLDVGCTVAQRKEEGMLFGRGDGSKQVEASCLLTAVSRASCVHAAF